MRTALPTSRIRRTRLCPGVRREPARSSWPWDVRIEQTQRGKGEAGRGQWFSSHPHYRTRRADMRYAAALVNPEVDDDVDLDRDGLAAKIGGLKFVLLNGFDGLLVEAHAEGARDVDVLRISLRVDDDRDNAYALVLGAAGFVGEFGIDGIDELRLGDALADAHDTASVAANFPGAIAAAV